MGAFLSTNLEELESASRFKSITLVHSLLQKKLDMNPFQILIHQQNKHSTQLNLLTTTPNTTPVLDYKRNDEKSGMDVLRKSVDSMTRFWTLFQPHNSGKQQQQQTNGSDSSSSNDTMMIDIELFPTSQTYYPSTTTNTKVKMIWRYSPFAWALDRLDYELCQLLLTYGAVYYQQQNHLPVLMREYKVEYEGKVLQLREEICALSYLIQCRLCSHLLLESENILSRLEQIFYLLRSKQSLAESVYLTPIQKWIGADQEWFTGGETLLLQAIKYCGLTSKQGTYFQPTSQKKRVEVGVFSSSTVGQQSIWCRRHQKLLPSHHYQQKNTNMDQVQNEKQFLMFKLLLQHASQEELLQSDLLEGMNILQYAIEYGSLECLSYLLHSPAVKPIKNQLLNHLSKDEKSPLIHAILKKEWRMVYLLIEAGSDYYQQYQDSTALEWLFRELPKHLLRGEIVEMIHLKEREKVFQY